MKYIFVYITNPDKTTAEAVARHLLEQRLIACANMYPIQSMFWWKDDIQNDEEYVLIAKSLKENYSKIVNEVTEIHPYDVPCISKIEVEANESYFKWLNDQCVTPDE